MKKLEIMDDGNMGIDISSNGRIGWIDWAKSICMFLVVLGHCHIRESEQFVNQFIYSFHMMFFFFLSGMLCKRELSIASIKKDVQYIILPYITYGFLIILFNILRSRSFELGVFFHQLESLLIGLDPSIGPIWFLPALFACKQLFLIIKKIKNHNVFLYYLIAILSLLPSCYCSQYQLNFPFFFDSALLGLPFFILGNESFYLFEIAKTYRWSIRLLFSILLCCASVYLSYVNGFVALAACIVGKSVFLYFANAIFAIISICLFCTLLNGWRWHFITVTSYGSIATLGLHGIPLTLFNYYLPIVLGYNPSSYPLYLAIIYAIITYYLCSVSIKFLDIQCPRPFGLRGILTLK